MQENVLEGIVAADWCCQINFEGEFELPVVLDMDAQDQKDLETKLQSSEAGHTECPSACMLLFVFKKRKDFELFNSQIVDKKKTLFFSRFEKIHEFTTLKLIETELRADGILFRHLFLYGVLSGDVHSWVCSIRPCILAFSFVCRN